MSSIFALLGFPTNDPVLSSSTVEMSDAVKMQMNLMPSMVNSWQQTDIANGDTSGYHVNPNQIGNDTTNTATTIIISAGNGQPMTGNNAAITTILSNTYTKANTLLRTTVPAFEYHTQRMSNMVSMGSDVTNPHYELATGYGKILTFITNKTDGIQNNSIVLGSFGSILAANIINANANTLLVLSRSYANTINVSSVDDGLGHITTTYSSNISMENAQALYDATNAVYTLMNTYKTQDTTFFTNSKSVMDAYNKVSNYSRLGESETDLIMNHIGSDKLKTRLTS